MLDWWYGFIGVALPFKLMGHTFMKNALLAVFLATPLFGILGTMVVSNRMAFFSDSLGHSTFTGLAIGALLGGKPLPSIIALAVAFAVVITVVKNKSKASTDTIIGVFASTAIAVGLVILSHGGKFGKFTSFLIGDLLSITPAEITMLFWTFAGVVLLWLLLFNKLLILSINPSLAASRGIKTLQVELLFSSALAVVVAMTIQWVGILLINSLLVLPAAAARNVTVNVRQYHFLAVVFALAAGITGLVLSYYWNAATGSMIVLVSAAIFFATFMLRNRYVG